MKKRIGKKKAVPVLAEGEHTGHKHQAFGEGAAVMEAGQEVWLEAPHGAEVRHEEHKPITLPPGTYDRLIVREYDHFAEEARNVAD